MRTIANIGLGLNSIGEFKQAIPYFLNALSLNPNGQELWKYLERACTLSGSEELLEKARMRDLSLFRNEFNLITPETLPKPSLEKLYVNDILNR